MTRHTRIVRGGKHLKFIVCNINISMANSTELDVNLNIIITQFVALDSVNLHVQYIYGIFIVNFIGRRRKFSMYTLVSCPFECILAVLLLFLQLQNLQK